MGQQILASGGIRPLTGRAFTRLALLLPPLAEQQRIVAKVDEFTALRDRLDATLQSADSTRARLLESLLHGALAGERGRAT